ncbi:MAG: acetyl-CoA carboxylase carboxyl transferase subunit alpha [Bacteriovoracaceae bacterium]|nr:acetyl-CoA carboxylase carboxyl transferase subunit alpha [Bacteriovoracaceae bacterium]
MEQSFTSFVNKKRRYLEFERPLQDLDNQVEQLKNLKLQGQVDVSLEIKALEKKSDELLKTLFDHLTPYQIVQLARHPDRPSALDHIDTIFDDFTELSGDRAFMEDKSIVGGLASLDGIPVMLIGHQKGKTTQENVVRNFGMPKPEGYRKALRLMSLAEQWKIPLITFIDTPGAYPGIEAEERGQAEAIAKNILVMTDLKTPILSIVLGEGGSGGALAIAVADRLLMMQYSIYSVISPEGCAAITWKDGSFASKAAEALQLTAADLVKSGIADLVVPEPLGGAHRDPLSSALGLKAALLKELKNLQTFSQPDLLTNRYSRFRDMGPYRESPKSV